MKMQAMDRPKTLIVLFREQKFMLYENFNLDVNFVIIEICSCDREPYSLMYDYKC